MTSGPGVVAALCGGLLLGLATPPAPLPLTEWLVVPALAVWFALATGGRRPLLSSYLYGCVHMAWFSWSVRHVLLPAYLAIVVVGGLYYLLATACVRGAPRRWAPLSFAVAVAGSFWLRAMMPEIHYPHGQPCHCLYEWPALMRTVAVGGEPLLNALLALCGATAYGVWSSWRVAVPAWRVATRVFVASWLLLGGAAAAGFVVSALAARPSLPAEDVEPIRVTAIEPGYHPDEMFALPRQAWGRWYERTLRERLLAPTRAALAASPPPDLVLWPESSLADRLSVAAMDAGDAQLLAGRLPAADARLLVGATAIAADQRSTPAAVLLDLPSGDVVGYQLKQQLVPGGEFLPLLSVLPDGLTASLRDAFEAALGSLPDCAPGGVRPPLRTAAGVPFGALLCYDNAFPGPAAAQVAQGAELLVVLSNEAWYRGGAELDQLVAMTVVRACENAVPIVRCTQDGRSVAVRASGELASGLAVAPAPRSESRNLQVSLDRGAGKLPPLAWLRQLCGPLSAFLTALGAAHAALWRVRLRITRTASAARS